MNKKKRGKELVEEKGLPHSEDAEKGIISCLFHSPDLVNDIESIGADAFYLPHHRMIVEEMVSMKRNGKPIELVSVSDHFQCTGLMEKIGGPATLAELFNFIPSAAHYAHYKSILRDKQSLRKIVGACNDTLDEVYENQGEVQAIIGRLYQRASDCMKHSTPAAEMSMDEVIDAWADRFEKICKGEIQTFIPTRWKEVNNEAPLRPGYTVIMGPQKSGKSCLGFNLITDACIREGRPGLINSYELPYTDCINRIIADIGSVPAPFLFEPDKCPPRRQELKAIAASLEAIRRSKLRILTSKPCIEEFCNIMRSMHAKYGEVVGLVDYLQIAPDPKFDRKDKTREQEVARNSALLRDLSKELNCPVIALSQTNKDGSARESMAPMQDCDLTLRVEDDGVRIVLQRNGPSGRLLPLQREGEYFRFAENQYNNTEIPD